MIEASCAKRYMKIFKISCALMRMEETFILHVAGCNTDSFLLLYTKSFMQSKTKILIFRKQLSLVFLLDILFLFLLSEIFWCKTSVLYHLVFVKVNVASLGVVRNAQTLYHTNRRLFVCFLSLPRRQKGKQWAFLQPTIRHSISRE